MTPTMIDNDTAATRTSRRRGRLGERAEDRQPAADGVRARGEPLVRQGLPARQHDDDVAAEQVRRSGAEVVGLSVRGGDGEGRAAVREQGGQERAQRRGSLDGQRRNPVGSQVARGGGEGGDERQERPQAIVTSGER